MLFFKKSEEKIFLPEPDNETNPAKNQLSDFIWETLKVIIISLAIIIPVRYFLIQPFYVKGASMEPNFYDHEYLIIDEITYRLNKPHRGDVIVFRYPNDPRQFFIKRIIGLPGETVKLQKGVITVKNSQQPDGFVLNEDLYLPNTHTQGSQELKLNIDEYYVLGDNRVSSFDSRMFGPVKEDNIIGRAWIRGWPFNRITIFKHPTF